MADFPRYVETVKKRYQLKSDYVLAKKLGIAQPEVNLIRRGKKVPNPDVCIKIANLLEKNPVELLLIAQKDKAPAKVKKYWTLALTAVDVLLHVPARPRYLPRKIEAIGRELREMESQMLTYDGASANAEAVRLMEMSEQCVDAIMERWNIWKRGEALYPNYLVANQLAVARGVKIRRLLIFSRTQMELPELVEDAIRVMEDQARVGVHIFYGFRDCLNLSPTFQRLEEDFQMQGAADDFNAAMFDKEVLIFSKGYRDVQLGKGDAPPSITMINRLQILWRQDLMRNLNPALVFDLTKYVVEYRSPEAFQGDRRQYLASTPSSTHA